MNIKAVPTVTPYQVNTATEASDEERQAKEQRRNTAKKRSPSTSPPPPEEPAATHSEETISRQLIDSEKMVEMLSASQQRGSRSPIGLFKRTTKASTQSAPIKKLNRVL